MDPKIRQDYEASVPRCWTCVYFKRVAEPAGLKTVTRMIKTGRHGRRKPVEMQVRPKPSRVNPKVDMCTFGNFQCSPSGVCREWHSREGERLESEFIPMKLVRDEGADRRR